MKGDKQVKLEIEAFHVLKELERKLSRDETKDEACLVEFKKFAEKYKDTKAGSLTADYCKEKEEILKAEKAAGNPPEKPPGQ